MSDLGNIGERANNRQELLDYLKQLHNDIKAGKVKPEYADIEPVIVDRFGMDEGVLIQNYDTGIRVLSLRYREVE